jgi:hypothetical protein
VVPFMIALFMIHHSRPSHRCAMALEKATATRELTRDAALGQCQGSQQLQTGSASRYAWNRRFRIP